jgi:hypothetical protein
MAWARANGHVVFTHDLDFGTTLALTHAADPSVTKCVDKTYCLGKRGLPTKKTPTRFLTGRGGGGVMGAMQERAGATYLDTLRRRATILSSDTSIGTLTGKALQGR